MKNLQNRPTINPSKKGGLINYSSFIFKAQKESNKLCITLLLSFCALVMSLQPISAAVIDAQLVLFSKEYPTIYISNLQNKDIDNGINEIPINSCSSNQDAIFQNVIAEPSLVSCKINRKSNSLELQFKNLEITSSDIEITIQSNTGERISFTADNYDIGDDVFIVPLEKDQLKIATSIVVLSFYIDVYKNPQKISLEKNQTEITKL
jgi:hypothetical protein